ncbi:DNA phosphorothioation system sulfurtransferase DndC [Burkholderia pseudomallei]|uniref:DNA phosphorothioation system sulfurtransferase DndC n=1 Tax=Burkholderia pseudomallei TaxID=28450 RepID=UPI0018C79F59|nr:DNA phosphorothioation system sulfurtransferase DndC [Burkholderia pseudomallei]MBG1252218.1 DNA phosphorothioation system sulfurtransferase DndC [Burkholderia pseudomallei]
MEKVVKFDPGFQRSAFSEAGIEEVLRLARKQVQDLYLSDDLPWVVGYSGGKDSTATLQLIWTALRELPEEQRARKPVHVISTDTLVENPVVAMWVTVSLEKMRLESHLQKMPFRPNRLTPTLEDRYWVNLIGRGYPAPRPMFRWCTSRLKINPSNRFITDVVDQNGEAILVLGTRKQESQARKKVLESYETSTRALLSRNSNAQLDRVWVYTPISNWSNDDVWEYLVTENNPWQFDNRELLNMYRGATQDNECPLVVDSSTPSCGDSRFGCFVCTLVDKDKSMQAMIKNDEEKRWMLPLSEFRNRFLDVKEDWGHRDFRRMDGRLTLMGKDETNLKLVHGPYRQRYRELLLRNLLEAQEKVRASGVAGTEGFTLIELEEIEEIRRIWVKEKHELEDSVPQIFEEATGCPYPCQDLDESRYFQSDDIALLRSVARSDDDPDDLHFELVRELLHVELKYRTASRRAGIYQKLDDALVDGAFANEGEAYEFAKARRKLMKNAEVLAENLTLNAENVWFDGLEESTDGDTA